MFDAIGNLLLPILKFLYTQTGSLGVAIIVFTILIRIVMLPLTFKQLQSQKKTMLLQPKIRELQRKHGKDREKLSQETMKLYKETGTNPASSCLPLIITLPILFGVWRAILLFEKAYPGQAFPFLWISSLTPTAEFSGKDPLFILPVLSVILQFITQQMAMPRSPDPQQAQMQRFMVFMPLLFGWFAFTIPAGAVLYMVTGSIIAAIQQYFTTGFGSLPKYLPFLPERSGYLTAARDAARTEAGSEASDAEPAASQTRDFWTVLAKLSEPVTAEATSGSVAAYTSDTATEAAIETVQQQIKRGSKPKRRRKPASAKGDSTHVDA